MQLCVLCWVLVVVAVAAVVGNELTGNGAEVDRVALDVVPLRVLHFVEELVYVGRSVVVVVVETIYVDLSRLLVRVLHRLVWSVEGVGIEKILGMNSKALTMKKSRFAVSAAVPVAVDDMDPVSVEMVSL